LKVRIILLIILGFFIFDNLTYSHALKRDVEWEGDGTTDTTTRKDNTDSVKEARAHAADSLRDARAHAADSMKEARTHAADSIREAHTRIADSTKLARKQKSDSLVAIRKHIADSSAAIRKYHDSKHYKDSVTRARTAKTNALKNSRQAHMDSLKDARKLVTDKMTTIRKAKTDSIKTIQKKRSDSLAAVKKYKTSKRYSDSVNIVRRKHLDSIQTAQKATRDRLAAMRKHTLDSAKTSRTHIMDSIKTVRVKRLDSIKLVLKKRTDSLAKVKKLKEDLAKAKEKKKEEDKKLKLEIKMKQKHEAWTNKSMLKKKWSPFRRFLQNSFTHYNYYYNAKKKMDEALVNMQRSRKENYDSLIGLYPFDPNRDSSLMSSDMDTIVRKISVGIQIHDPRVKWDNDLYLLLGEAYYYRGRYENASIAFRYIISKDEEKKKKDAAKNGHGSYGSAKDAPSIVDDDKTSRLDFLKHKSVHNEAVLWLARTYTEARQVENAESILSLLASDAKLPNELKGRLATEKSFVYLTERNYEEAAKQLPIAADDNNLPNWLRVREAFIEGQLQQNLGHYTEAAASFEKVISYYPKIEMDFYSRKYIAYNKLLAGESAEDAMRPLKRVLTDAKYLNYYDQVYFVLGQLAIKAHENDQAVTYFTKSATTPKATKKQKALSYSALGDVYYAASNYSGAKMAYDSASKYSSAASKDATVINALQRDKGLEQISGPSKVIHDQDSLMALSALSKKEQLAVVRRYLRYLEKMRDDSIADAENSGVASLVPVDADDASKDASNWYFSNPALMTQGSIDFKRKWGNRPLTDNWQHGNGNSSGDNSGDEDDASGAGKQENGLPTEESLLAKIPNTTAQKELSAKIEQRAYMLLAKGYMKQLEDYPMANNTLDTFDVRFPENNFKEEELYLRYQLAMKQNKIDKAQLYSAELLNKFPNSQYADNVRPRTSESKPDALVAGKTVSQYFDETYNLLMQHQYAEALTHVGIAKKQFDNPVYKKRFQVAEAMGYAGSGEYDLADTMIKRFIRTYPADTLTPWASTVEDYIGEVRNGGKPPWFYDTIRSAPESAIAKTKTAAPGPKAPTPPPPPSDIPSMYGYHADSGHYCIIVLPGIDSKTMGLKKAIKDLDNTKYPTAGLNVFFDLYSIDQGVIVVERFPNAAAAKKYMDDLSASNAFNGYSPGDLHLFIISAPNYKKMFADKKADPYFSFYSANYR